MFLEEGTILLILNIVFIASLVIGFLVGLLKGLKKSTLRLTFYFVAVLISAIIAPILAKVIMNINITYQGSQMTISDMLLSMISKSQQVQEMMEASEALKALVQNIPLMLGNVVVFTVCTIVLGFLSYIVYLIIASIVFKSDKKVNKAGVVVSKAKKYRILGGLVSAVQALAMTFLLFLPVTGVVGVISDVYGSQEISAEYVYADDMEAKNDCAKLIDQYLPDQVKTIINAFNKSLICNVSGVGNLDDAMFNAISTVKVNNVKISLRDEVVNIAKVYNNVSFVIDLDFSDLNVIKTLDYDRLISAVEYVFNSNMLKATLPELANYGFDKLLENHIIESDDDYKNLVLAVKHEVTSTNVMETLKSDLVSVLQTAKTMAKSGILDNVPLNRERDITKDDIKAILAILSKDQKAVLNEIVDKVFESGALNKGMLFVINKGLNVVEEKLSEMTENEELDIKRIDLLSDNSKLKKAEVKSMLASVVNVLNESIDADFEAIKDDFKLAFDLNLNAIVSNLGSLMNAAQNMSVFAETGIYNNIVNALEQTKYTDYVDFNVFKEQNIWISETELLAKTIDELKASNVLSYVHKEDDSYVVSTSDINQICSKLAEIEEINGKRLTAIRQIVEPLYESKSLKQLVHVGLEKLNDAINELGKKLGEDVVLGDMNYEDQYEESEKENLLSFLDNVVLYVKDLDISKVQENPLVTILKSNLAQLGSCMDSLKATSLFGDKVVDGQTQKGIYNNLVDALKATKYADYINFGAFNEEGFSFNVEFAKLQDLADTVIDKKIAADGTEYPLLQYIIDVGDWEVVFGQITREDLSTIFTPLMKNKIFEPIGTMVINKINEQIKNMVGEFGADIDIDISDALADMSEEEIEQIIDILGAVSEIIDEISDPDFELSDLINGEHADALVDMLTAMQDNANEEGVFASAYDALLDYAKQNEEIGERLTLELENYQDGEVDWQQVIESLKG